jgi:hypothetical protein
VSKNFQDGNTGTLEFWILDESGIAAASSSTFVPTWSGTCDNGPIYSSAFFAEIDQTTPTGAKATNSTDLATPNPITTTGLSTTSGDVVVTAALGYSGTDAYSPQNSFTEGNDHNADDKITLGTAYKAATGATETPSMTNSDYTSDLTGQSIIGVVLNYDNGATPDLEQIHYRWRNDNGGESSSQTTIYLTSGTSWVVPADWNNSNNSIEVIGGGGGGESRSGGGDGGGGGGGAYSKETNVSLTASSTVTINIGSGGAAGEPASAGGDTYLCNSTSNCASIGGTAVQVGAKGGAGGSASAGGAGGASGSGVGTTKYSGGAGAGDTGSNLAGGGGGAAGPSGAGATATDDNGGAAGNGSGGAGGTGGNPPTAGGDGTEFSTSYGSGGGGGGGSGNSGVNGATGGNYGGGGGGGSNSGGTGAAGNGGLIVITYTPSTSAATFAAAEDTAITGLDKSTTRRLRLEISNEGTASASNTTYRLEVSEANPTTCAAATGTSSRQPTSMTKTPPRISILAFPTRTPPSWPVNSRNRMMRPRGSACPLPSLLKSSTPFRQPQVPRMGPLTASV